ncbi:MAG: strawberry notch family protein, partial [Bacteroidetes bacterium]|nr:strawberry notch family protein [Bacteroidota bacterium]
MATNFDNPKKISNLQSRLNEFVCIIEKELKEKVHHNKRSIEKLAASFGIIDKTEIKELTELAIVKRGRELAHSNGTIRERFDRIVELYNSQVNLSHRTSQSILLQQYSTPAPIAYLAGVFCGIHKPFVRSNYFEPSAGNGLLTIAGNPFNFAVNEIDPTRNRNLHSQSFYRVLQQDATKPFVDYIKTFDAVLTNPPFGISEIDIMYDTFRIKPLEHVMALRALDCMKDNGKAAIIIGGQTRWDDKGRIQAGKQRVFFNYLHSRYNVADVINIDGHKLYSRQGTSFDVRLILVNGRRHIPSGAAPVFNAVKDVEVKTFDELFERVMDVTEIETPMKSITDLEKEALNLQSLFGIDGLGAPYEPASDACIVLNTQVPDSMAFETKTAIERIKEEVGGDIDNFVRHRLKYPTKAALCKVLSAEQIDAVAMAIYNIEARSQGMIIGDQTGIGKGRVAAAMIRYAVNQGLKPMFLTEKANLFSDIYRDLVAIGSGHLKPFIVNGRESKTDIKDEDGNVVYQAPSYPEQQEIFTSRI